MSTNYYFSNKKKRKEIIARNNRVEEIFDEAVYNLVVLDEDIDKRVLYDVMWKIQTDERPIHIGKRSFGWMPLFQANEHFKSMAEMKTWYSKNQNEYIIESEYGEELTWNELDTELIQWKGEKAHLNPKSLYTTYFADKDGYEWTHGEFS